MAAILRYFNAFIAGELNSASTHIILLGGSLVAEFAVAIGIILESPREKSYRERLGMVLVLGGVSIGAALTIALFVFDEGISRAQQSTITVQQAKIIALENELAPRILDPPAQSRIANKMRLYPGTHFDLSALMDSEPMNLLDQIEAALAEGEWVEEDWKGTTAIYRPAGHTIGLSIEVGITIGVAQNKEASLLPIAKELAKALTAEGVVAEAKFFPPSAPINPAIISIAVGRKPTRNMGELFAPTVHPDTN
jgi:hypothetical protein